MGDTEKASKSILSFVAWAASIFVYLCFVAWALLPSQTLHYIGVTYYPSRYYAIALPAYVLVVYALSGIAYIGINMMNTNDPEDMATVRDSAPSPSAGGNMSAPINFTKITMIGSKDSGIPDIGDIDPILASSFLS